MKYQTKHEIQLRINGFTPIDELVKNKDLVDPNVTATNCLCKLVPCVSWVCCPQIQVTGHFQVLLKLCLGPQQSVQIIPFKKVATLLKSWSMSQWVCPTGRKLRYICSKIPQSTKDFRYANKYLFLFSLWNHRQQRYCWIKRFKPPNRNNQQSNTI